MPAKRKLLVIAYYLAMRGVAALAPARGRSGGGAHASPDTRLRSVEPEAAVHKTARGDADQAVAQDPEFATPLSLASAGVAVAWVHGLGRARLVTSAVAHPLRDVVQRHTIQVNHRDSMATSPTVTQATNILRKHFSNPAGSPPVASRLIETGP